MTLSLKKPVYSTVIPVYDSGPQLQELVDRLARVFEDVVNESYEIILIDDGSTNPATKAMLPDLARLPNLLVVNLTRNFGKPGAVMCGLAQSRGDWIITIDDDLQQRPEDIPKLIELRDHGMVTATYPKKQHSWSREFTSRIKQMFDRGVLGYSVSLSALKLIQRHVVDGMLAISTNRPFIPALIRQVTADIVVVESLHEKSAYPKSRYTFRKRWIQFSNLIIGNSGFMMRLFAWVGFSFAAMSFVLAVAIIARKLFGQPVPVGWSSLMVTLLLVGGLNLAAIGVSGQYFIRILDVSSKKPAYIIRDTMGGLKPEEENR